MHGIMREEASGVDARGANACLNRRSGGAGEGCYGARSPTDSNAALEPPTSSIAARATPRSIPTLARTALSRSLASVDDDAVARATRGLARTRAGSTDDSPAFTTVWDLMAFVGATLRLWTRIQSSERLTDDYSQSETNAPRGRSTRRETTTRERAREGRSTTARERARGCRRASARVAGRVSRRRARMRAVGAVMRRRGKMTRLETSREAEVRTGRRPRARRG